MSNTIDESHEYCKINKNKLIEIRNNYKGKVFIVDFPYSPLNEYHWNSIQRISLNIGVNEFLNKVRNIALIDADEFLYIPKYSTMNIKYFLKKYNTKITTQSNILTNKNNTDIINNNILQIAVFIGENRYHKTILYTNDIEEYEFITTPHNHPKELILNKEEIIHYHC